MHSYIEIALINALMILPLALIADGAGRVLRRPALTHLLWVLVLVKLITPPVWQIPVMDRDWLALVGRHVVAPVVAEIDRFEARNRIPQSRLDPENSASVKSPSRPRTLAEQSKRPAKARQSMVSIGVSWIRSSSFPHVAATALMLTWGLGALIWFAVQGFRCLRFRWTLARGTAAGSELQQFSDQLAHRLGLARSPTVWLMPGVMSPMLWGNGQSTLLIFPEQLLDRLDPDAAGTLLTHELAHFRRRDHWVRVVALIATGFFWWHPVVWWARRAIEVVEEECCDALVLKSAAAPPKRYAEALLDTVDFLAEFHLKLPPLATGLGQVPFLRQRLTWIMRGPRNQNLGYCGRAICAFLAVTLPLQPTWLAARSDTLIPTSPPHQLRLPEHPETLVPLPESPDSESAQPAEVARIPNPALPVTTAIASRWTGFVVRSQSTEGRFVVMGNKQSQFLLDLESGRDFELSDFLIGAMAFSTTSNRFVSIGADRCLRLWNAETFEVLHAWQIPGGSAKSVDLSADGRWIVTGGRDGVIRVWNESSSQPICELPRELAPINCLRFSQDSQLLAVATGDWMSPSSGRIALYDVHDWTERISMNWNSPAAAVAFRADGMSLTSADWQGRIARWSLASGELLGLTYGHKDLVAAAEFSPSGSALAEVEIPDLRPDDSWFEPQSREPSPWFFKEWPMKSLANPTPSKGSGRMSK